MSSREAPASIASTEHIASILKSSGFENFGFATLSRPVSIELYEQWLENGHQGEMSYLDRHLPEKREPHRLMPRANSAIVVTMNYVPHPEPLGPSPSAKICLSNEVRIAAYARGRDYHSFIRSRLQAVIATLKNEWPSEEFLCFTDSAPVLERDLAAKAGLGWIGKNTCLLSRENGSLFFIAEIYTSLVFSRELLGAQVQAPKDFCGTCTRCIDACPTQALISPRELDARLCISYLTIESRKVPNESLRAKIGDWFFGCDVCQTVCPWNHKVFGSEAIQGLAPSGDRGPLIDDLRYILSSSNRDLERNFRGTPLSRPGGWGLKRNALVVAANRGLSELAPEIQNLCSNPKLGELAQWALSKIRC